MGWKAVVQAVLGRFYMSRYFGAQVHAASSAQPALLLSALLVFLCSSLGALLLFLHAPAPAGAPPETKPAAPRPATHAVLMPFKEVQQGVQLTPALFRKEEIPESAFMPGMVDSFEHVIGTYSKALLVPDRPFYAAHVMSTRPSSQVGAAILPGYRGVTIRVNEETAVEGWVRPGSRVDVALITTITGRRALRIVVSNALVLSAARDTSRELKPDAPVPNTVTLMVTPQDAARIKLGGDVGKLSLLLRGDDGRDYKVGDTIYLDERELLGMESNRPVQPQYDGYVILDGHKYFVQGGALVRG